jgi:bifunctional DNA-binding transcriptional regulator/antitoxin component of YhaV-PrlF toxin-antitoxin module
MERKIISVSAKRQVTIPQKYFEYLGFDREAECVLQNGGILIRPIHDVSGGEFSEQILSDLIAQGYEGEELLRQFKLQSKKIRPAVESLLEETDAYVKSGGGKLSFEELFGAEAENV